MPQCGTASNLEAAVGALASVPRAAAPIAPALTSLRPIALRRRPLPENDFPSIDLPERPYDGIREFYLSLEPALLDAIQLGDRREARRLINNVLIHIYAAGQERSELLKGLLLELVVMMSRAAAAAGSGPSDVLGINFQCLTALAEISDDEQLAHWLRETLDLIFSAIERQRVTPPAPLVVDAIRYIRQNASRNLTRDDLARALGLSPSHCSHLLHERTGLSFTRLLRQARVQLACELLLTSEEPLAAVADRCGFYDQSHFTRVFVQAKRLTPRQYREANRPRPTSPRPDGQAAEVAAVAG